MNEFEARNHLPDEWAKKATCPVCMSHGLIVNHTDGPADRMVCPFCQVSFEIAQDFTHIRMMRLPNKYIMSRIDLIGAWIDPVVLKTIIGKAAPSVQIVEPEPRPEQVESEPKDDTKSILSSLPKLTQEETTQRALNLKALGNSTAAIQNALTHAGAAPEQISLALDELNRVGQKKVQRQTTLFWVITGAVTVLVLVFAIWVVASGNLPVIQSKDPTPTTVYLSIPDFSGNGTPTSAMSPDTQSYFKVLWNLQGDYVQRADKLKSAIPPDDLKVVNQKLIDDYTYAGLTKKAADDCLIRETTCSAPTPDSRSVSSCKNISKTCSDLADQAQKAYNQLSAFITADGCNAWQQYYNKMNEPWVMTVANGRCRAP